MTISAKSNSQLARVATNLAIGVVGLMIVRLIASALPMFHDAGWIVEDKLTVQAGVVIAVDALLLTVAGIVVLIFRDRDSMAALILRQPMPNRPSTQHSDADESTAAVAGR